MAIGNQIHFDANNFIFSQKLADLHEATTLSVHFKDLTCIKYRRDMYMTWDGLLGELT